ncbi:hypothetical protein ACFWNK_36500 [Streptomyces sp. NPDC058417]|uniref:hypothetical protein n=1 Tax=unclassified Streptomyces TaxID=2593676 RepID=UPI00364F2590
MRPDSWSSSWAGETVAGAREGDEARELPPGARSAAPPPAVVAGATEPTGVMEPTDVTASTVS